MDMRMIEDISRFIFVEDELERADAIFVPGGSYPELAERAAQLWREGYAGIVVPAGRYSVKLGRFAGTKSKRDLYGGDYETECEFYTDVMTRCGVPEECIVPEDRSQWTAANAQMTREVLDARGIAVRKAIIVCKGFHARRCLMFYQFCFPEAKLMVAPCNNTPGIDVTRDNWYRTEMGITRVLGELARLGTQFGAQFDELRREFDE